MNGAVSQALCAGSLALALFLPSAPTEPSVPVNSYQLALSYQEPLIRAVGDRVFFQHQDADLTEQSRETLDKLVVFLAKYPNDRLTIEGHAHDFDTAEENDLISKQRAEIVLRYLIEQGIDPSRLSTVAHGLRRPAVPGDYEEARAQNRRVEFVLETD